MLDLVKHELGTVTCATKTCSEGGSIDIEFMYVDVEIKVYT